MYLDRFFRRFAELSEIGCFEISELQPCSPEEISAFEKKRNLRLPGVLRELYSWGGKSVGDLFGTEGVLDFEEQMRVDFLAEAREILEADGEDSEPLEENVVMVEMTYDSFSFLRTNELENPAVYGRGEAGPVARTYDRFSDYLEVLLEAAAGINMYEYVDNHDDLLRLVERPSNAQHLIFGGEIRFQTVPNEIFELRHLRSLNLVGRGLIDLPPRIKDLSSLRRLDLARNSLPSLPMALAHLEQLEELDLSENHLDSIIDVLRRMPNLKWCDLKENPLPAAEIEQLRSAKPEIEIIHDH